MARVIDQQTNLWGRAKGVDIQRSDLWIVDFSDALEGLDGNAEITDMMSADTESPSMPRRLATYFAQSVSLPDLKVRAEHVRRDSRPYQMPSWDEPLEAITMVFLLDCHKPLGNNNDPYQSDIYKVLDAWRSAVRAGRGGFSDENAITLDDNYGHDLNWNFDVRVKMLRGASAPSTIIDNDLEYSLQLTLVNCWLSSFKVSELSYEGSAKAVTITAIFYAEDILSLT